jgi:hypothetical protein
VRRGLGMGEAIVIAIDAKNKISATNFIARQDPLYG